jgi:RNA polymerase sigma factor (sigma-70 family)
VDVADVAAEHYDLVEKTARRIGRRFLLPSWMNDDLVSAGNEAIVRAAADPRLEHAADVRAWLRGCVYFGIIQELRAYGRPGTLRYQVRSVSLDAPLEDGEGGKIPRELVAPGDVDDNAVAADLLRQLLDACPSRRHREVVVRAAAGESLAQIGGKLDVSEARVSEMLKLVRRRIDHGGAWPDTTACLPGSWR